MTKDTGSEIDEMGREMKSNKALRDGAKEIIVEITTDHDCNLLSDKIMDIYVDRLFALVTNHIKGLDCMQMEKVPSSGEFNAAGWANYDRALGRNEIRSQILKEMGE